MLIPNLNLVFTNSERFVRKRLQVTPFNDIQIVGKLLSKEIFFCFFILEFYSHSFIENNTQSPDV